MSPSRSRNPLAYWFLTIVLVCLATIAVSAHASTGVVVGSYNPQSQVVTLFEDRFVHQFADGRPIDSIYTVGDISNGLRLVRSGKTITGSCFAEVFSLSVVAGGLVELRPVFEAVFRPLYTYKCTSISCDGVCLPPGPDGGSCRCGPILLPTGGVSSGVGQCKTERVYSLSYPLSDLFHI